MKLVISTIIAVFLLWLVIANAGQAQADSDSGAARDTAQPISITRSGSQPASLGSADYFTGAVHIDTLFKAAEPARTSGGRVTFDPGARTAWHTHPLGQTLIVTAGTGRVQRWGDPVEEIRQGDVVWIPPGQKHWHGAAPNSAMTHIAIAEQQDGKVVQWLEKVSDEQYNKLLSNPKGATTMSKEPSTAQKLVGDIAPKLAELTDTVLFGDVWERKELSKRDRSLVTVAALVAMNRPEQLKFHLDKALDNGVKREELIETITHLAFYSGWPSAMTAIMTAKEQFAKRDAAK